MNIQQQLQQKIDLKTKPLGALGQLEQLALQIGTVQNTLTPTLNKPSMIVFAGDHGIAKDGVSAYPQEVTFQMVLNFLAGGAGINVFSKQHGIDLIIVDTGVNYNFSDQNPTPISALAQQSASKHNTSEPNNQHHFINAKIANGTASFLTNSAMTNEQLNQCLEYGKQIVLHKQQQSCNVIGFGEMGIGNTSSATLLMSHLCDLPIEICTGRGTGVDDAGLTKKIDILTRAKAHHGNITDPKQLLATFGGFEIAQMCGAILTAYEQNMLILVDGFIASSAFLVAHAINPNVIQNAIFCHVSDESGHKHLLDFLDANAILSLNMRLGEGTGCALAYPIILSAVNFLNDMASFESARVSSKT